MVKKKAQYPEDFKTMFGVSTMGIIETFGTAMITGTLMLYITDYSGLYMGIAGKAAAAAALMLLIGRIWDAVNDPLLGFVMDRSPRTKIGRFKPFLLWATPVSALLLIALFNVPAGASDLVKLAWLYIGYFLFDTALTLLPYVPITQTLTEDTNLRARFIAAPRIVNLFFSTLNTFFIPIAIALGKDGTTPNIGLATILFVVPMAALSFLGVTLVKEGNRNVNEEPVEIRDIRALAKMNRPLWTFLLSSLIGGFSWSFIFAAQVYYIKYAFGVENFGTQTATFGGIMIFSILLGTLVSQWILKIKGITPGLLWVISYVLCSIPLGIPWAINLSGPITSGAVFYPLMFLAMLAIGMNFVPGTLISMECMDYNKHKIGKSMEGTVNSLNKFTNKIQAGFASALTGMVLAAIGYDAAQLENASVIPPSLFSGLGMVLFALPAIFALISAAVVYFFYPLLKSSQRNALYADIERGKPAQEMMASE